MGTLKFESLTKKTLKFERKKKKIV